jgi:hypothetical protein
LGARSDELHQVKRDVFVAAAGRERGEISHDGISLKCREPTRTTLEIITVATPRRRCDRFAR